MQAEGAFLADVLLIEARLAVVVGVLAPAAAHGDDLLGGEAQLGLEGFTAVGALALLGTTMDPVVIGDLLLTVLSHTDVPEARLAREVQAAGALGVRHHSARRALQS